eukprot:m.343713 g.343713  ORF g.343713 m.343713 type:complete len:480 (-) comp23196_c0_seq1:14-1453(-)
MTATSVTDNGSVEELQKKEHLNNNNNNNKQQDGNDESAPFSYNIIISVGFLVLFSAFLTTQNLLTSVVDEDVAFNSLAVLYFTFAVGNLLSSGVVARVPVRLSLVFSALTYTLWHGGTALSAYGVADWPLYATSVVIGIGAAVLWVAQGVYVAALTTPEQQGRWFGFFFFVFGFSSAIGQGLALLFTRVFDQSEERVFIYMTVISGVGSMVFFAVRPIPPRGNVVADDTNASKPETTLCQEAWETLLSTIVMFADTIFLRCSTLGIIFGSSQAYFFGTVPSRMPFQLTVQSLLIGGGCVPIGSFVSGRLSDFYSRVLVIVGIMIFVIIATILTMIAIEEGGVSSDADDEEIEDLTSKRTDALFMIAYVFWGLAEGGMHTQLRAAISVAFEDEDKKSSAMAAVILLLALFAGISFLYGGMLHVNTQGGIVLAMGVITMCCMLTLSLNPEKKTKNKLKNKEGSNIDDFNDTIAATTQVAIL